MRLMRWLSMFLATNTRETPGSYREIVQRLRSRYNGEGDSQFEKQISSTVKFSFVPPSEHSTVITTSESLVEDVASHCGEKPLAVYLPGLDCQGLSAGQQFEQMAETFEFWRMTVETTDRSTFEKIAGGVVEFVLELTASGRDVVLVGESFGGLLAPAVAMKLEAQAKKTGSTSPVGGLVLVNPATSYDSTNWDVIGPLLASLERFESEDATGATPYTVPGGLLLGALVPDNKQYQQILDLLLATSTPSLDSLYEGLGAIDEGFGVLGDRLPADLIRHRVCNWMNVGAGLVSERRLSQLDIPTLVLVGEDDKFLPSKQEADRLVNVMPSCKKVVIRGAGHFVLDERVNLTEAIIYSDIDPLDIKNGKTYDPIVDWVQPTPEEIQSTVVNRVDPLRKLTSPVFFSTDSRGKRWKGIGQIPSEGPIVFVANHQLIGLDLGLILAELLLERGIVARGLAHPVVFQGSDDTIPGQPVNPGRAGPDRDTGGPFDNQVFRKFGAVKVSPRNYYRLLQTGQNALLFPGGVREVFHGKDEAYQLFWPEKVDFVRTAARFNATVVPLSALGAADSFNVLLDGKELVQLPFVGERLLESARNVTAARYDQDNADELFQMPLVVPKFPPARHYFVFGKPMETTELDYNDKEACQDFYKDVKKEMERGFSDVLRARKEDPYGDSTLRLAVEQVSGKQAPTFPLELINKA